MPGKSEPPDQVEWGAPPPPKTKGRAPGSKWDPIAAQLKENPGRWACIGRGIPTGITTTIRRGELKCFKPAGSFECVVRNYVDRWTGDVYVRYVGNNQEYA